MKVCALFITCLLIFSSCDNQSNIYGSGNIIEEPKMVEAYDRVIFSADGLLTIEQGPNALLKIKADDNIIPMLQVDVKGRTLQIDHTDTNLSVQPSKPIQYIAVTEEINKLVNAGKGEILSRKKILGEYLILEISDGGKIALEIDVKELKVTISGSGEVFLTGHAEEQTVTILNNGLYQSSKLGSKKAVVKISGEGKAKLHVSESLNVEIDEKGTVEYTGSPKIEAHISGEGSVHKISTL